MDFQPPICTYCKQMYSRYNEPIFIVCLCDEIAKYAHGSCFRGFLKNHSHGVCGGCFTKTKIIPDGYKSLVQWKIPKLNPLCGFWSRLIIENRYWKIVYCRETKDRKRNQTIRRYSDVPEEIPWQKQRETLASSRQEIGFEVGYKGDHLDPLNMRRNDGHVDTTDFEFQIPTVFVPRGYPYVKRSVEEDELPSRHGLDESFEYYPTFDQQVMSWNRRSMNGSSFHSVSTGDDDGYNSSNVNEDVVFQSNNENISDNSTVTENNEVKKPSKLKSFFARRKKPTNGRTNENSSENSSETNEADFSKERKSCNNNSLQQYNKNGDLAAMGIDENQDGTEVAVIPLKNDIIFKSVTQQNSFSGNEIEIKRNEMEINIENDADFKKKKSATKKIKKLGKGDKKNKKNKEENLSGLSTAMFKPVIQKANIEPKAMRKSSSFGDRSFAQLKVENLSNNS